MDVVDAIMVDITVELGSTTMPVHHLLRMGRGAVIELDTTEHDPMTIRANGSVIAKGEVQIDDGRLSVEVIEKVLRPS